MSERRAISTVAAITLVAVSCVLGLGLAARTALASGHLGPALIVADPSEPDGAPFTLGLLGLEPGALALIGLSGVVCCWPGHRRRPAEIRSDAPLESAARTADRDQLLAPAA